MDEHEQADKMDEKIYDSLLSQYYDSQKTYDKTILTFSGGALSFSLLFKERLGINSFPVCSWVCWVLSLIFLMLSMYFSTLAHRKALESFYASGKAINEDMNIWDKINLYLLNPFGGILFIMGLIFFLIYLLS